MLSELLPTVAHGPWWSEWHHFLAAAPLAALTGSAVWHWISSKWGKKSS